MKPWLVRATRGMLILFARGADASSSATVVAPEEGVARRCRPVEPDRRSLRRIRAVNPAGSRTECCRGNRPGALDGIAFIHFFPLAIGALADAGGPRAEMAVMHQPAQLALAWLLLKRSPVMLPIISTGGHELLMTPPWSWGSRELRRHFPSESHWDEMGAFVPRLFSSEDCA